MMTTNGAARNRHDGEKYSGKSVTIGKVAGPALFEWQVSGKTNAI
jgi:hypothetical protein